MYQSTRARVTKVRMCVIFDRFANRNSAIFKQESKEKKASTLFNFDSIKAGMEEKDNKGYEVLTSYDDNDRLIVETANVISPPLQEEGL